MTGYHEERGDESKLNFCDFGWSERVRFRLFVELVRVSGMNKCIMFRPAFDIFIFTYTFCLMSYQGIFLTIMFFLRHHYPIYNKLIV